MRHIHYEACTLSCDICQIPVNIGLMFDKAGMQDENTRYIDIGPVNKAMNMLCCYFEDPDSQAFKKYATPKTSLLTFLPQNHQAATAIWHEHNHNMIWGKENQHYVRLTPLSKRALL